VSAESRERSIAAGIDRDLVFLGASDADFGGIDAIPFIEENLISMDSQLVALHGRTPVVAPDHEWKEAVILGADDRSAACRVVSVRMLDFAAVKRVSRISAGYATSPRAIIKGTDHEIKKDGGVISHSVTWRGFGEYWTSGGILIPQESRRTFSGRDQYTEWSGRVLSVNDSLMPRLILAARLSRLDNWQVNISAGMPQSVTLLTDPVGVKEWFRLRDVPDGKNRRSALLHWVSKHSRQSRKDPESEIQVRAYLRGASEWDWFGMGCRVIPAVTAGGQKS